MTVLATDDFNRADNPDLGAAWNARQNSFKILTNTATPTTFTDSCEFYSNITWPNDQYSQVTVTGISGTTNGAGIGAAVRVDPTNLGGGNAYINLYWVVVNSAASNNVSLVKRIANVETSLGQRTQAFSNGDIVRLEVQGTTLRVYRNGVQLGADFTDSSIASGSAGMSLSGPMTAGSVDAWEGGSIAVAGAGTSSSMTLLGVG